MPSVYFVMQRHHSHEFPALYYDYLPEQLTRKLPVDDKRKPIEQPALAYTLRLDRISEPTDWRVRPLDELLALYRQHLAAGTLPPSNIADPPRKQEQGTLRGESFYAKKPPGYDQPPAAWPVPGTLQLRPQAGAFIPVDVTTTERSPLHGEVTVHRPR
jgi:hypothetical protein